MTTIVRTALLATLTLISANQARAMMGLCDVRRYGAKGDGVTDDTAAIQRALDDCGNKDKAPGEVLLQAGIFLSGPLVAHDTNEWLLIKKDAILRATSHRYDSWWDKDRNRVRPLLLVTSGDLRILGGGLIQSKSGSWDLQAVKALGTGIHNPNVERPTGLVVSGTATVSIEDIQIH